MRHGPEEVEGKWRKREGGRRKKEKEGRGGLGEGRRMRSRRRSER
jgi:hypothetical protein